MQRCSGRCHFLSIGSDGYPGQLKLPRSNEATADHLDGPNKSGWMAQRRIEQQKRFTIGHCNVLSFILGLRMFVAPRYCRSETTWQLSSSP